MRLTRALPAILAAALLTVGASGCGVKTNDALSSGPGDGGGTSSSTTTEARGSGTGGSTGTLPKPTITTPSSRPTTTNDFGGTTTTSDVTIPSTGGDFDFRNSLIDTYQSLGLTKDQATCLTDGILSSGAIDPSNPSAAPDLDFSNLSDILVKCNVSISDFSDGGLGN